MIMGGPASGDSNRARRASVRTLKQRKEKRRQEVCRVGTMPEISFGPEDEGEYREPHGDALVITTDITRFYVARIFVDMGSSTYILFTDSLRRMSLNVKLEPMETAIYRFTGGKFNLWVR